MRIWNPDIFFQAPVILICLRICVNNAWSYLCIHCFFAVLTLLHQNLLPVVKHILDWTEEDPATYQILISYFRGYLGENWMAYWWFQSSPYIVYLIYERQIWSDSHHSKNMFKSLMRSTHCISESPIHDK